MKRLESGVYTSEELLESYGNYTAIHRAKETGDLVKIGNGYYCTVDCAVGGAYKIIEKYFSDAIVSRETALFQHGLINRAPDVVHIDLPRGTPFKRDTQVIAFHRISTSKLIGVEKQKFYGVPLKTYSPERAVFEVLFIEENIGSLAREVARNYAKFFGKKNSSALREYGQHFGERGTLLYQLILSFSEENDIGG